MLHTLSKRSYKVSLLVIPLRVRGSTRVGPLAFSDFTSWVRWRLLAIIGLTLVSGNKSQGKADGDNNGAKARY